jgi:purine-binding chemotaxis protein CheW
MSETAINNDVLEKISEIDENTIQYVVFSLNKEEYAIQVDYVQEIIKKQDMTRIPRTLPYVAGMINLRGHIVPVIDSKKLFKIKNKVNAAAEEKIILLVLEKETVGLIVDNVTEVIYLNAGQIEPPPATASVDTEYIQGVGKYEHRLLMLLNPETFCKDV